MAAADCCGEVCLVLSSSVLEDALEDRCFLLSQVCGEILLSAVPPSCKDVENVPEAFCSAVPLISRMLENKLLVSGGLHTSLWSLLLCEHPAWVCGHEHPFWGVLWVPLKNGISNLALRGLIFGCLIP